MFQSPDHRYLYEIQTAHSRTLMVFDRCSQRSYTSSNNKTLNARLLARRHKFVTWATLLQLVLHQCMNTAINRICRTSNKCEPPDIPVKFFANQHNVIYQYLYGHICFCKCKLFLFFPRFVVVAYYLRVFNKCDNGSRRVFVRPVKIKMVD
jgi:hypothetical protein